MKLHLIKIIKQYILMREFNIKPVKKSDSSFKFLSPSLSLFQT